MHWIFIALIAPFIWSILNHTDKYLLSKYAHEEGVGGLVVFSSLFAILVLPIIFFIDPSVIGGSGQENFFLTITGIFMAFGIIFYLYALQKDEASYVTAFWFLIPVFAYIFGVLFLKESLEGIKILGSIITLLGAAILSLEFEDQIKVKSSTVLLMVSSSLFISLSDVVFKGFAIHTPFWQSIFWNQIGMAIFGISAFLFIKKYRHEFFNVFKMRQKDIVAINTFGEVAQTTASIFNYYATLLAPVSLVLLVAYTFQPLFVFVEGIFMTKFFPKFGREHLSRNHVIQKIASIIIMFIGIYLIYT